MYNIGLDFGTTNSILSYHNGHTIDSHKFGGAGGENYLPSAFAIDKADQSTCIGRAARSKQGDSEYDVYQNFKMLLGEPPNSEFLQKRGYTTQNSAQVITQRYLTTLLEQYCREGNINSLRDIEKIVITIPEIWVREGRHNARESLKEILRNIGIPYKMLSEPVAAAIYFAHRFEITEKRAFKGHVLVCDYGGGTLDLNLSYIEGNNVKVLDGTGTSRVKQTLGVAGVAYDEKIVTNLLGKKNRNVDIKTFQRLLSNFEQQKIGNSEIIGTRIGNYLKNNIADRNVFTVEDLEVKASDMTIGFNDLIKPVLIKALTEMMPKLETNRVNIQDGQDFRVVMVGGFSNFCLVRQTIKEFFKSQADADSRFITHIDLNDTALAISKGAALWANNNFTVEQTCPINIGIYGFNAEGEEVYVPILQKGISIREYESPQFMQNIFYVQTEAALAHTPLKIGYDIGHGKKRKLATDGKLKELLPSTQIERRWKAGFSVDEDLFFTLHIKDDQNKVKSTPIAKLTDYLSGLHFTEE